MVGSFVAWLLGCLVALLLGCLVACLLGCLVAWFGLVAWLLDCLLACWLIGWVGGVLLLDGVIDCLSDWLLVDCFVIVRFGKKIIENGGLLTRRIVNMFTFPCSFQDLLFRN